MCISHASGVGSSFGFRCTAIRTIISWAQFMLPVIPDFARFLHLPLDVRWKRCVSGLSSEPSGSGQAVSRIAVAVGVVTTEDEDAVPAVRGTDALSVHHLRPAGVACSFHVVDDPVSAVIAEATNVLNENPTRSELLDDAVVLEPKAAPLGGVVGGSEAALPPCAADILARESAADDIDGGKVVFSDCSDIQEPLDLGPTRFAHLVAERVDLDSPNGADPRPFEAEVYSADAGEQRPVG